MSCIEPKTAMIDQTTHEYLTAVKTHLFIETEKNDFRGPLDQPIVVCLSNKAFELPIYSLSRLPIIIYYYQIFSFTYYI